MNTIRFFTLILTFLLGMPVVASADSIISKNGITTGDLTDAVLYADKTTALANGEDKILLTLKTFKTYSCLTLAETINQGFANDYSYRFSLESDGATLSKKDVKPVSVTEPNPTATDPSMNCEHRGAGYKSHIFDYTYESIYVSATTAGVKNIAYTATYGFNEVPPRSSWYEASITFNEAPYVAPPVQEKVSEQLPVAQASPQTSVAQVAPEKNPPAVPVLETLIIGGANHKIETNSKESRKISLKKGEAKIFKGKTIPNGKVRLFFHSNPFEDTVVADKNGLWSYALKKDIGIGEHTVQISVIDPATNLESKKSKLVKFSIYEDPVSKPVQPSLQEENINNKVNWYLYFNIIIFSIMILVFGYLLLRHFKTKKTDQLKLSEKNNKT